MQNNKIVALEVLKIMAFATVGLLWKYKINYNKLTLAENYVCGVVVTVTQPTLIEGSDVAKFSNLH